MVQFVFEKSLILLTTIYFLVVFSRGNQIISDVIDIQNQISPTPFDAFSNESDSNVAESIKNQPKSRRKRYVAFPEGSSFSVTLLFFKYDYIYQL